jgi:hypothetical protein
MADSAKKAEPLRMTAREFVTLIGLWSSINKSGTQVSEASAADPAEHHVNRRQVPLGEE